MKHESILCNIGHFDSEIQVGWLENNPEIREENIKPQVDQFIFPDGKHHSVGAWPFGELGVALPAIRPLLCRIRLRIRRSHRSPSGKTQKNQTKPIKQVKFTSYQST